MTAADIVRLEACSDDKVSYHLIFKKVIFINNKACKDFISFVLSNISPEELAQLTAFDSSGSSRLVIDLNVYHSNQNFRLLQSSKFGKNIPLKLIDENFFNQEVSKDVFLDTLVYGENLIVNTSSAEAVSRCVWSGSTLGARGDDECIRHSLNVPRDQPILHSIKWF